MQRSERAFIIMQMHFIRYTLRFTDKKRRMNFLIFVYFYDGLRINWSFRKRLALSAWLVCNFSLQPPKCSADRLIWMDGWMESYQAFHVVALHSLTLFCYKRSFYAHLEDIWNCQNKFKYVYHPESSIQFFYFASLAQIEIEMDVTTGSAARWL